jgi:hypothetical protein
MEVTVKKRILIIVAIMLVMGTSIFAQQSSGDQDAGYYYVNVSLEKIYPYRKGYVVEYLKGFKRERARLYLPVEWFTGAAQKAEIINLPAGTNWPSLTVYYKDNEFSHLRLYVRHQPHETWGHVPLGTDIDAQFENVTDIKIEF